MAEYPRPNFVRTALTWESLNGLWHFLFDDADAGLLGGWARTGLLEGSARAGLQARQVVVPFAFQTAASGIDERADHEVIWYERRTRDIRTPAQRAKGYRLLLRFGAVDYEATVWAAGRLIGTHRGGHVPFDMDITEAAEAAAEAAVASDAGAVRITVRVRDSPHDLTQPRGKQYWKPRSEEIWYKPTSGIWQSVWLESVPPMRIGDGSAGTILRANDLDTGVLHAEAVAVLGRRAGASCWVEIEALIRGVAVAKVRTRAPGDREFAVLEVPLRLSADQQARLSSPPAASDTNSAAELSDPEAWRDGLALWSPRHPQLYDLVIRLYGGGGDDQNADLLDEVSTTTGMRSLGWTNQDGTFRLNGRPLFQSLVLDQGYWPDTGMTPPSQKALRADIEMAMAMGFNGCRKHQKVEDPAFLYWADRLGFLVWSEMANVWAWSAEAARRFDQEWIEAVRRDINHACVITWTPVNESWGYPDLTKSIEQRNHIRSLYYMTKALDPSRPINDNCGWEHVLTDLTTFHDYRDWEPLQHMCASLDRILNTPLGGEAKTLFLGPIQAHDGGGGSGDAGSEHRPGAPIMCTEFGGVNIAPAEAQGEGSRDWGYTTAADPRDLLARIERLIMALVRAGNVCALVYTQLSDIEQEVNGLYSWDRKAKIDPARVREVIAKAESTYYGLIRQGNS